MTPISLLAMWVSYVKLQDGKGGLEASELSVIEQGHTWSMLGKKNDSGHELIKILPYIKTSFYSLSIFKLSILIDSTI